MKHKSLLASLLLVCFTWIALPLQAASVTSADQLETYYKNRGMDAVAGTNLWSAVQAAAKYGYSTSISYSNVWTVYKTTDSYTENGKTKIYDMYGGCDFTYSTSQCGSSGYKNECDCYNREHSIPKSWFGGSEAANSPGSDVFHLVPTDGKVNGMRSNYAFGEVNSATYNYNGSKLGTAKSITITNTMLGTSATKSCSSTTVFEPIDEYKGDFARGYMGTLLHWAGVYSKDFTTGDGSSIFSGTYTQAGHWGLTEYGIALLLKWHRQDPVSQKEIDRNNGIQSEQGNRNPFIDYPELAEYIWGEHAGETFYLSSAVATFSEDYDPTTGTVTTTDPTLKASVAALTLDPATVGGQTTASFTLTGKNLTGDILLAVDNAMFKVSPSSITAANANKSNNIAVIYKPTATGTHTATLTISSAGATAQTVALSGSCAASRTVEWWVDGAKLTTGSQTSVVADGGRVTVLPAEPSAPSGCDDKVFVGWSTSNLGTTESTKPSVLFSTADDAPTITADTKYYAVFATKMESSESVSASVTFKSASSDGSSEINSSIADQVDSSTGMSSYSGTKVYIGKSGLKLGSSSATGSVTCTLSKTISAKTITVGAAQYGSDSGTLSVKVNGSTAFGSAQNPSDGTLTFTVDNAIDVSSVTVSTSTKRAYVSSITVGGTTGGTSYSNYVTQCTACTPSTPTASFAQSSVTVNCGDVVSNAFDTNSNGAVTYSSSKTSVATVNSTTGEITIVAPGTTTITATVAASTCFNTKTASYTLTVNSTTGAASFAATTATMNKGETATQQVQTNSDGAVTYTSSNTAVATVNNSGTVTAVAAGTARITASVAATTCTTAASAYYDLTVYDFKATDATNITSSGFTANWTTAGADSYSLDVYTGTTSSTTTQEAATFLENAFTDSQGSWTTSGTASVWSQTSDYGMKANKKSATDSKLISPNIDLSDAATVSLSFAHTRNTDYGSTSELTLQISTDGGTTWSNLTISNWTSKKWEYVTETQDLSAYKGNSAVKIAFVYNSGSSNYNTWEIKNFKLSGTRNVTTTVSSVEHVSGYPKTVTGTSAAVTGLQAETTYKYTVTPNGGTVSNEIEVTTAAETATYTVVWLNGDGTELDKVTDIESGANVPQFTGYQPTKAADAQYTYEFAGSWTPANVTTVTGNITFTPVFTPTLRKYAITWVDGDGKTLKTENWDYGATPSYNGATPTKTATAQYTYTFSGWTPEVEAVTGDATYTAQFSSTVNSYTITWKNADGTTLKTESVAYGTTPAYTGTTPTKEATAQYTYTFSGWTPAVVAVAGDQTYTATYTETVRSYVITYVDEDDKEISHETLSYGTMPAPATPTKDADVQYTYSFDKWVPALANVTGTQTYKASFKSELNKYTITWKNADGTTLKTESVAYGTTPTYTGTTPTKEATAQYTYTFSGWTPEVVAVTGNATYTATYTETVRSYVITYVDEDDKEISHETLSYGTMPNPSTPTKDADVQYTYSFDKWVPALAEVTGTQTYKASFKSELNKYTITWKNADGTMLKTESVAYGTTPTYTGTTPTKEATAQYTYTFSGWTPVVVAVAGDQTYTATYTETVRSYVITYVDEDDREISHETLSYGTMPNPATPTKDADVQYTYSFDKWVPALAEVTGTQTYKASFKSELNKYTMSFDVQGHGTAPTAQTLEYGSKVTQPVVPTEVGYTFGGWYKESECQNKWDFSTETLTENRTLYALWTLNEWTLAWDLNGGEITSADYTKAGKVAYGTALVAPVVKQTGYEFAGWNPSVPQTMPDADATYTATWAAAGDTHYTVNHYQQNLDDDNYTKVNTEDKTGATSSTTAATAATYEGFSAKTFAQKTIEADGSTVVDIYYDRLTYDIVFVVDNKEMQRETLRYGATPAYDGGVPQKAADAQYTYAFKEWSPQIAVVTQQQTYTAVFTSTPNPYTITYYVDGKEYNTQTYNYGAAVTALAEPTKEGYTFSGWSELPQTMPANDVEVSGRFTINTYTIIYKVDGEEYDTQRYEYGATVTALAEPTKEGYTFSGWSANEPSVMPAENLVLIGEFTANTYTITFWYSNQTHEENLAYDALIATNWQPTLTNTAEYTYEFKGWKGLAEGAKVSAEASFEAEVTVTPVSYTLTYMLDGEVYGEVETIAFGTELTLRQNPADRMGYTFSGWSELPQTMPAQNITVTGSFSVKQFTITYKVEGEADVVKTYDYNATVEAYLPQDRTGYTFSGWSANEPSVMPAENLVLIGAFTANTYTITFWYENQTHEESLAYDALIATNWQPTLTNTAEYTYKFKGWKGLAEGAKVSAEASFEAEVTVTPVSYTLTYMLDGEVYGEIETIAFGTELTLRQNPADRMGYTFSGWSELPQTMPANDVEVSGTFTINTYTITYNVDGEEYDTQRYEYGATVTALAEPTKEGYTFSGWSELPHTMPASDVEVSGRFEIKTFTIKFVVDGEVVQSSEVEYGEMPVYEGSTPERADDEKYTYTFSGWEPEIAEATEDAQYTATFDREEKKLTVLISVRGNTISCNEPIRIYSITGQDLTDFNGQLPSGSYIVTTEKGISRKVVIL